LGFLWVTHDLALAAAACDRLLVLYGGSLLEAGPTSRLLTRPRHPYTVRLLAAALGHPHPESGCLPAPENRPPGCPFQPRCRSARKSCETWSPWRAFSDSGLRCDHP
jgi:oligopeptide/dipeptide ABC transporter ATP-binding protein